MTFRFQHSVDSFLTLLGPNRTLAPSDFDRYFGKILSKVLVKKLQDRPMSLEIWSPKSWSMALETSLSEESIDSMDGLLDESGKLLLEENAEVFQPVSKGSGHLSWKFFGDCPETLLSKLSAAMKQMERVPQRILESFVKTPLEFQGIDYFFYKNKEAVAYLKVRSESLLLIREIEKELWKQLGFPLNPAFTPHITLGRIKNWEKYERLLKTPLEKLWESESFQLFPAQFMLFRHLDHLSHQGLFGLVWN